MGPPAAPHADHHGEEQCARTGMKDIEEVVHRRLCGDDRVQPHGDTVEGRTTRLDARQVQRLANVVERRGNHGR